MGRLHLKHRASTRKKPPSREFWSRTLKREPRRPCTTTSSHDQRLPKTKLTKNRGEGSLAEVLQLERSDKNHPKDFGDVFLGTRWLRLLLDSPSLKDGNDTLLSRSSSLPEFLNREFNGFLLRTKTEPNLREDVQRFLGPENRKSSGYLKSNNDKKRHRQHRIDRELDNGIKWFRLRDERTVKTRNRLIHPKEVARADIRRKHLRRKSRRRLKLTL